jgi:GNAT superfamily N-acetyltransferase
MQTHLRVSTCPEGFNKWPELLDLVRQAFSYMDGRINPPSSLTRMGVEEFKTAAAQGTLIVAHEGQTLVGCAFAELRDDCVYVGKVAVAQSRRGKGVARSLLAAAEEIAKYHDKQFLELQTRVELVENHATFAALGFQKMAETAHPGYDRPTSITMRRPVG